MLKAVQVEKAKASEKDRKLFDERGLFLLVTAKGGRYWRLKYRFGQKEKVLALGVYPEVSLAEARILRDEARAHIRAGVDPSALKQARKQAISEAAANSFASVAAEWLALERPKVTAQSATRNQRILERDLYPQLGKRPISDITPPELLQALRKIESRGVIETAHRARSIAGLVFRYAIATGKAERDPSADLKGLLQVKRTQHYAAITKPEAVGPLMVAIDGYQGSAAVVAALRLAPRLFCRIGELRHLQWSYVDLDAAKIEIPAEVMKMREAHIIPLSNQAVEILRELHLLTGRGPFVFPSVRSRKRPISENTINAALRYLGYDKSQMTGHGFRAMARTLLDEVLGFPTVWIEQQLAHAVSDPMRRAYNRTAHLAGRRDMMQAWSDYLERLKDPTTNVVELGAAKRRKSGK